MLAGGFLEKAENIVGGAELAAIDGEQIFAGYNVDAGLRERRAQIGIPIFAVINARETVAAIFDGIIGTQQPHFDLLEFRNVAAADEHVADI